MENFEHALNQQSPSRSLNGIGYAVAEGQNTGCWSLAIGPSTGSSHVVSLCEISREGHPDPVASMSLGYFRNIAKKIDEEFNRRLVENGREKGSMPRIGGSVYLNAGFGRELATLFIASFDSTVVYEATKAWLEATPTWRRKLFSMVDPRQFRGADRKPREVIPDEVDERPEIVIVGAHRNYPQAAYELLCYRDPDGNEDAHREAIARAPAQAMEAQIWAIRRKSDAWGANNKASWNGRRKK